MIIKQILQEKEKLKDALEGVMLQEQAYYFLLEHIATVRKTGDLAEYKRGFKKFEEVRDLGGKLLTSRMISSKISVS